MYSELAISALEERIGWSGAPASGLPDSFAISEANKVAASGRTFENFHPLVILDNIYHAVAEENMEVEDFNDYLADVRRQNAIKVLTKVFDHNDLYFSETDYSETIIERVRILDDALGYSVAANMLGLFISTSRSNFRERNAKMAYNSLKVELEGAKNDNGFKIATGINDKLNLAIKTASKLFFPRPIIVTSKKIW